MMNETINSILGRRSIRRYNQQPVEKEKIEAVLECGCFAPSAMNLQPWHFTVITNREILDKISAENRELFLQSPVERMRKFAETSQFDSFSGAPMAIIVSGDTDAPFAAGDCANAVENMAIAAYSMGLGSCYNASFKMAMEKESGAYLLRELGIPQGFKPLYALAIGYSDEKLGERAPRRENAITYL